jgi:hypothetical protein
MPTGHRSVGRPAPHTGKSELVKGLGTANLTLAGKLAAPLIAEFHAIVDQARKPGEMVWRWVKVTEPAPCRRWDRSGGAGVAANKSPAMCEVTCFGIGKLRFQWFGSRLRLGA